MLAECAVKVMQLSKGWVIPAKQSLDDAMKCLARVTPRTSLALKVLRLNGNRAVHLLEKDTVPLTPKDKRMSVEAMLFVAIVLLQSFVPSITPLAWPELQGLRVNALLQTLSKQLRRDREGR